MTQSKQPPAFQAQSRPPMWARTPPAIFPVMLGSMSIGLAWRQAGAVMGAPAWIGEMILGAILLLLGFGWLAYGSKLARRPGVLADDLKILPGRAGLSAGSVALMLAAAALVPYNAALANAVLAVALALHLVIAVTVAFVLLRGPVEQRRITPVWHLTFVGFIVVPVAGIPLGWVQISTLIFALTLPIAAGIWAASALQFARQSVPPPLRPLLAIHLAPASLFTIVAASLGYAGLAQAFALFAVLLLVVLVVGARWLTQAGFSAFWGAFTFPMAAFCNAMFAVSHLSPVRFEWIGAAELVPATLAVAYIAFRIMQLWAKGALKVATNAATA